MRDVERTSKKMPKVDAKSDSLHGFCWSRISWTRTFRTPKVNVSFYKWKKNCEGFGIFAIYMT